MEKTLSVTSSILLQQMTKQQDLFENQTNHLFTTLEGQLANLATSLKYSKNMQETNSKVVSSTVPQPNKLMNACDVCLQSFASKRTLADHLRTKHGTHQPKK